MNDTVNLKVVVDVEDSINISPYVSKDVYMGKVKVVKGQGFDGPVCRLIRLPDLI